MEKMSAREPETVARQGEKLYSGRGDFQGRSGLPNGVSRTEMLVGNEVGRGGNQDPSADKKALSSICKKKEEVAGQEHLYMELTEWTRRPYEPNTGKSILMGVDVCFKHYLSCEHRIFTTSKKSVGLNFRHLIIPYIPPFKFYTSLYKTAQQCSSNLDRLLC